MIQVQRGFAQVLLIPIVVIALGVVGYFIFTNSQTSSPVQTSTDTFDQSKRQGDVGWRYDMETGNWSVQGDPPACPDPLIFPAPVDVNLASGLLYPGQIRGTDYKPHGGFRFDNREDNFVEVRTVMDGYVLKAARYNDGWADQISIFFVNDCGIMVMHDHILTPSPKLQEILTNVPLGKDGDSRTTNIEPRIYFKKGELLATEIGYKNFPGGYKDKNIFIDFGLYDLRKTNEVVYDKAFRANHPNINEYGTHALCWFDYLEESDREVVNDLPASGKEGSESDYCS